MEIVGVLVGRLRLWTKDVILQRLAYVGYQDVTPGVRVVVQRLIFRMSGKAMARTGLRMMPTFPLPPLKFRTASFPRYGFKAGLSDGAFPAGWFAIVLRALCCHR